MNHASGSGCTVAVAVVIGIVVDDAITIVVGGRGVDVVVVVADGIIVSSSACGCTMISRSRRGSGDRGSVWGMA